VWLVSVALAINTTVVALGQVPLTTWIAGVPRAARAAVMAGVLFAASCAAMALAGLAGGAVTVAVVLVASVAYSVGEVLHAAAAWELSFDLADPLRPAEYQGLFSSGLSVGAVVAPALITTVLGLAGDPGWLALGGLLGGLGLLHLPAVRGVRR
jgi:hypothetical protein